MEIKAADVMKLRKMTGAGMMDCKKALIEAEGDFARAQDMHTQASDWLLHRHDRDKAYDTVILHVVGESNCDVYRTCLLYTSHHRFEEDLCRQYGTGQV